MLTAPRSTQPTGSSRRSALIAWLAAIVMTCGPEASHGRQPASAGRLSCDVTQRQDLSASDENLIRQFVADHVRALLEGDLQASARARDALLEPLSCSGVTFAFRSRFGGIATPALQPLLAHEDERIAANALVLLGRIRTTASADAITDALGSPNSVVRFAAAAADRDLLSQLAKDSFGFPEAAVDRILDAIGAALAQEPDPLVGDALVLALGQATAGDPALRGRAMHRLTSAVSARIRVLRGKPEDSQAWSATLLRALDLARSTMFEQAGTGRIDPRFAKESGLMCGQLFCLARDRVVGRPVNDPALAVSVGAAESFVIIANKALVNQTLPERGAQRAFEQDATSGKYDALKGAIEPWIGPGGILLKPHFGASAADFAPIK